MITRSDKDRHTPSYSWLWFSLSGCHDACNTQGHLPWNSKYPSKHKFYSWLLHTGPINSFGSPCSSSLLQEVNARTRTAIVKKKILRFYVCFMICEVYKGMISIEVRGRSHNLTLQGMYFRAISCRKNCCLYKYWLHQCYTWRPMRCASIRKTVRQE